MRLPTRAALAAAALAALASAACADRDPLRPPAAPAPRGGEMSVMLSCAVDLRARTLACAEGAAPPPAGAAGDLLVGGQGVYVRLASANNAYETGDTVFRTEVTLQNLLTQAMGTTDGATPHPEGVRVFFHTPPAFPVVVLGDGTASFTGADQPFFRYPGILAPGATSAAKAWRFRVPGTLTGFTFQVAVSAPVPFPDGWVDVDPGAPVVGAGDTLRLFATRRTATGRPLADSAVAWASSDTLVARVDGTGLVTGVADGTATVTATSGARTGTALVTVGSTGDLAPPEFLSLAFAPDSVDVTAGDATVTWTVRSRDAATGITRVETTFAGPDGSNQNAYCSAYAPTAGNAANGTWSCAVTLRQGAAPGTWTVYGVRMIDRVGNNGFVGLDSLAALGMPTTLAVTNAAADSVAPALTAFSFTPDSVDVTAADAELQATFGAADAGVGVRSAEVILTGPEGSNQHTSCSAGDPESGTANAGTWRCVFGVLRGSFPGTWRVYRVILTDAVDNQRFVTPEELEAAGFPANLVVTDAAPDTVAPTLSAFAFTPGSVDVGGGDREVTATLTAADTGLGIRIAEVYFAGPDGSNQASHCTAYEPDAGTRESGTWTCVVTLPQGSASGTWTVEQVRLIDQVENYRVIPTAALQASGYVVTLEVTN